MLDYLPDHQALVVEWVEGRTLAAEDLRDDANAGAGGRRPCRMLHAGPRFVGDFDMFEVQRRYLAHRPGRAASGCPPRYLDLLPPGGPDRRRARRTPEPTVPCNNDLLAANFIDDGDRLWVIDYEYGGNNDPCFELGNIWSESDLSLDHLEVLVDSYYGTPPAPQGRPRPAARADGEVRLDALGVHPGRGQPDRVRLLVLGDGEVRPGASPSSTDRTSTRLLDEARRPD